VKIHIVKKGDTLYFIGQKYNVSIEEILSLNPGITNPDTLDVGMKIKIPNAHGQNGVSGVEIMHQHVVKQGDTLWKLSKAWGVPLAAMVYANPHLKNPNVLLTGEVVNIPKADTVVPPTAMPGKTNTAAKPSGGAHPLHPSTIMQGVQGIVGKLSTAPVIGKKNTAPIQEKAPTAPISPVPAPAPAPTPAPKEKEAKVEPLDTGKVEPLATKVEPLDTGKVEPLATKVEPLAAGKVEPLSANVAPLSTGKVEPSSMAPVSTGKTLPNSSVAPMSMGKTLPNSSVAPMSMGKTLPNSSVAPMSTGKTLPNSTVAPMSTNMSPLSANNVAPMSTNMSPLSANNVAPMSTNMSPLSANNVAPMSTNMSPLSANNVAPMSTNNMGPNTNISPSAVSPTPYASKKALPIEKAIEQKVSPAQSEYMQSMDMNLFQQYNIPATEAMYVNPTNYMAPHNTNAGMPTYGEMGMAPMYPYDCPPGSVMPGYPAPAFMPYGAGPGWGYPGGGYAGNNEIGWVAPMSNMDGAGMMPYGSSNAANTGMMPYANMNAANTGMMPYANMNAANTGMMPNNAGMVSPMSGMPTKGLPGTMSTMSMPSYDAGGYPMTYPQYAPYPLYPNHNAGPSPAPAVQSTNDDCGCGGKREDEIELQQTAKSGTSKFAAPKPRKKAKKAVIRTVAPRPKKKTTSGSRPWLNR
jgi:LysM repeat protein